MSYSPIQFLNIRNFQSLGDAHIPMGGLTVLVGEGDVGKSAVLRALRAICLNDGHDDDIRHGATRCEVELTFEDGTVISWWKDRGKGGCYRMGDTEYTKTGGAVPDAIAEYLGIGVLEIDATTELTPQFSDQHDTPFFFSETGSKRARILGKATHLDVVVTAQMQCKKELDAAKRGAAEASTNLVTVEEQLTALPDYEAIERDVHTAESNLQTLIDSITRAHRIEALADRIEFVRSRATAISIRSLLGHVAAAGKVLDRAERLQYLASALVHVRRQLEGGSDAISEVHDTLTNLQQKFVTTCEEAGVCTICGGLLNHKECVA